MRMTKKVHHSPYPKVDERMENDWIERWLEFEDDSKRITKKDHKVKSNKVDFRAIERACEKWNEDKGLYL